MQVAGCRIMPPPASGRYAMSSASNTASARAAGCWWTAARRSSAAFTSGATAWGFISNLIGENEVPDWLEEDGLSQYFDSVILSSVCHVRKPCAGIYRLACQELGVAPADCVSVADNVKRDLAGAAEAGIGANILFDSPEKKHPVGGDRPGPTGRSHPGFPGRS